MPTSPIIRLTLTPEIQTIMDYLKKLYPLLAEAEILKLALGGYYQYVSPSQNQTMLKNDSSIQYNKIKANLQKRLKNRFQGLRISQTEIDQNSF